MLPHSAGLQLLPLSAMTYKPYADISNNWPALYVAKSLLSRTTYSTPAVARVLAQPRIVTAVDNWEAATVQSLLSSYMSAYESPHGCKCWSWTPVAWLRFALGPTWEPSRGDFPAPFIDLLSTEGLLRAMPSLGTVWESVNQRRKRVV